MQQAPAIRGSVTSQAAADAIAPHLNRMERIVFEALKREPMTDLELIEVTGLGQSARPRRIKLTERGLVEDSGTTRKTASGRQAVVWRVKVKRAANLFDAAGVE